MSGLDPGPQYWETHYGIGSLSDFLAAADQYQLDIPGPILGFPPQPTNKLLTGAYYSPWGGLGSYLSVRFSSDGIGLAKTQAGVLGGLLPGSSSLNPENSMTQLIIPGAFQVTIMGVTGGRDTFNVIGVTSATSTAAEVAARVKVCWEAEDGPLANLPPAYVVSGYKAVDLSSADGAIAVVESGHAGGLGVGSSIATRAASALVQWNGGTRSRSSRGRLYFGPLAESQIDVDGATLTGSTQTALETAFSDFVSNMNEAPNLLAVLSRKNSSATQVTSHTIETTIATQRRRIRG